MASLSDGDEYELESPFFHRQYTHEAIESLASLSDATIYLGAGATVDRTGVSWASLVGELLSAEIPDVRHRSELLRGRSALEVASAASEIFGKRYGSEWRERLSDSIRSQLYQQPRSPAGKVVERAVDLAMSMVSEGKSTAIVTPNYDDFIYEEANRRLALPTTQARTFGALVLGSVDNEYTSEELSGVTDSIRDWLGADPSLLVSYMHGILFGTKERPEDEDPSISEAWPVLSERDYWLTAQMSRAVLTELFRDRNVLIAGSGMTDAPLLNALLTTEKSAAQVQAKRICLMRVPHSGDIELRKSKIQLETRRLQHFGVKLIPVDHYGQISQFFTEVSLRRRSNERYTGEQSSIRYGARLTNWWRNWLAGSGTLRSRQQKHVKYLNRRLFALRDYLGSADAEPLKLEVWIRWHPERARDLALWASTSGYWSDERVIRKASIEQDDQLVAVQAFSSGTSVRAGGIPGSRWKTYLATPFWLDVGGEAPIPLGVVAVASRWEQGSSSLGQSNATRASTALLEMHQIGVTIASDGVAGL